jgi:hypothetical protein
VEILVDFKAGIEPSRENKPFAFQYCNQDQSVFYHFASANQLEMVKWLDSLIRSGQETRKKILIPIKKPKQTISEQFLYKSSKDMMVTSLSEQRSSSRISYGNPKFLPDRSLSSLSYAKYI